MEMEEERREDKVVGGAAAAAVATITGREIATQQQQQLQVSGTKASARSRTRIRGGRSTGISFCASTTALAYRRRTRWYVCPSWARIPWAASSRTTRISRRSSCTLLAEAFASVASVRVGITRNRITSATFEKKELIAEHLC